MTDRRELDGLRAVVEAVREWVRRNELAEEAEEAGELCGDGTLDVGGGIRRDVSEWLMEAWHAMDAALKAAPQTVAADALSCLLALRWWASCRERLAADDSPVVRDELYDAERYMRDLARAMEGE